MIAVFARVHTAVCGLTDRKPPLNSSLVNVNSASFKCPDLDLWPLTLTSRPLLHCQSSWLPKHVFQVHVLCRINSAGSLFLDEDTENWKANWRARKRYRYLRFMEDL